MHREKNSSLFCKSPLPKATNLEDVSCSVAIISKSSASKFSVPSSPSKQAIDIFAWAGLTMITEFQYLPFFDILKRYIIVLRISVLF